MRAQNRTLSDSADKGLTIQSIGYLIRTGISMATISIVVNQYEAPPKPPNESTDIVTHIDIEQFATGLSGSVENRCVDDTYRDHSDWLFGNVRGKSYWVSVDDIEDEYLKGGWLAEGEGKNLVLSHVESQDYGWVADQVWGFQEVEGERRYCRNIIITKDDQRAEFRFVYDFEETM